MRLPGRKIWRAFRELDAFSDEQCGRFVRSANRFGWSSLLRGLTLLVVGVGVLLGVLFCLALWTSELDKTLRSDWAEWTVLVPLWTAGISLSPLAVLLLRDWMLIRRIRRLLRTRGQCAGCSYGLLGLPVDDYLIVVCPECGTSTKVDISLGELARDAQGRPRFEPKPGVVGDVPAFWNDLRKRRAKRLILWLLVFGLGIPLATWACYEAFLQYQAHSAARLRSRNDFIAWYENTGKKWEKPGKPGLWGAIARTLGAYDAIQADEVARLTYGNPALAGYIDASNARDIIPPLKNEADQSEILKRDQRIFARSAAIHAVERAIREGIFAEIDSPGLGSQRIPLPDFDPDQPILRASFFDQAPEARKIARLQYARMVVARQIGDADSFGAALRSILLIGRTLRTSPLLISTLVANAIEQGGLAICIEELEDEPRPQFVRAIDAALADWDASSSIADAIEGERLASLDCIEWLFSKPSNVRWGRRSEEVQNICDPFKGSPFLSPETPGHLGWFWENRDTLNARFSQSSQDLKLEGWQRSRGSAPSELAVVNALTSSRVSIGSAEDARTLLIRSLRVMLALEHHRQAHGSHPFDLSELHDTLSADDLRDPLSGKPFGYFKLDYYTRPTCKPAPSPTLQAVFAAMPYFLYACGHDKTDDFTAQRETGVFIPKHWGLSPGKAPGKDLLLNAESAQWENPGP